MRLFPTLAVLVGMASAASAASVSPAFVDVGIDTTGTATSTRMYRADLFAAGLSQIGAITITDSNSGVGGSSGIYSGFDLDAMFLDADGDLTTTGDQFGASSYVFTPGSIRTGGSAPPSPSGGLTNGSTATNAVDEAFATLESIDGLFFSTGSLTLGDGGSLTAIFDPEVMVGTSMFLFVGEVSGDPGETVTGLVEIQETAPAVPLPAGAPLLIGALGGLAWLRRRRG